MKSFYFKFYASIFFIALCYIYLVGFIGLNLGKRRVSKVYVLYDLREPLDTSS